MATKPDLAKPEILQWQCTDCSNINENSDAQCNYCRFGRRPDHIKGIPIRAAMSPLPAIAPSPVPQLHPRLDSRRCSSPRVGSGRALLPKISPDSILPPSKAETKPDASPGLADGSPGKAHSPDPNIVYLLNLPMDIEDDQELERLIRHRVQKMLQVEPGEIKFFGKIGVGTMHVPDAAIKARLVNDFGIINLDPPHVTQMISVAANLDLVCYIALDVSGKDKTYVLPKSDEVSHRCVELYETSPSTTCDQLNIQFPNIFRLRISSVESLINVMQKRDFLIGETLAQIYPSADCSFLEDVPKKITEEQLRTAIGIAIGRPTIPSTSLHIQINKQTGSVCIISADTARKWAMCTFLTVHGKTIPKKQALTCRLMIRSVPQAFPIQKILSHPDFVGKIGKHKHDGDSFVLELSDKTVFDKYVTSGVLHIDATVFPTEACNQVSNPEDYELDDDTWYAKEMFQYPANIMGFLEKPDHETFRYRWNPQSWLEQFKRVQMSKEPNPAEHRDPSKSTADQVRHYLRVAVMLNTIGIVRRKCYMVSDRQIQLNLDDRLKTIVYDHRSKLEHGGKMPSDIPPHKMTIVDVVRDDCLVTYERMVNSGRKPLLLNMANAMNPGGGYRKGDGAQEENIFRRSDYFRSLDVELDDVSQPQRPTRLHCSSNCQFDPLTDHKAMYPMDEFGAIYTSGLTIFRQSESNGYALMEKPLENVCALAIAAYRDPKLNGDNLAPKYAIGMLKKIQTLFAIAYHHKHDCLVLSAFGCGAFRNPPMDVAKLFRIVIEQYAGFFKSITFAIVDDHNAGHQLNPDGNFTPFQTVFHGMVVEPVPKTGNPHTMMGPYRFSADGSSVGDVCIFDRTPCFYGALCRDRNHPKHGQEFSHPPRCAEAWLNGKCTYMNDEVHMYSLTHPNRCRYGGECQQIDDPRHNREFDHPSYCVSGGACVDMGAEHLRNYRHLPLCKDAHNCVDFKKKNEKHCQGFRHCQPRCPHGTFCVNFFDQKHMEQFLHPFPPPCPFTPFNCQLDAKLSEAADTTQLPQDVHQHCLRYGHVCRFGRNCQNNTPVHLNNSIHVARLPCSHGDNCTQLTDEEHLNTVTHKGIADIRRVCKYDGGCHERHRPEHIARFRHVLDSDGSGIVKYSNLNEGVNFVQNQMNNIRLIQDFVQDKGWQGVSLDSIPGDILNWIRHVKPVHRCNPVIFESIMLHGHVMSRDYMEHLKKPKYVANSVLQHSRIQKIGIINQPNIHEAARAYITSFVTIEYHKRQFPPSDPADPAKPPRLLSASHTDTIKKKEKLLSSNLSKSEMEALRRKTLEIVEASIKLHTNPAGIGYDRDRQLGTNKTVFSVLGPHLGHYYGDVFIVFKREILHHPDTNVTMQAATSFASGRAFQWRPWLGDDPQDDNRLDIYHGTKLHPAVPDYEYATALELMAMTSMHLQNKDLNIDLDAILQRWLNTDSHQNIESHLPQLIPLDYIDHIYIPKNIHHSLNERTKIAIGAVFKQRITITEHDGELGAPEQNFGPTPTAQTRANYQNYVIEELIKKFKSHVTEPSSSFVQGTVITIPSSQLEEHTVLPLTISQAFAQYCSDRPQPPTEDTVYIYWQAMHGDMMLTVSNEAIDIDKTQPNLRCLICYVAPKPEIGAVNYHEEYSYLNVGQPSQHATFVSKKKFSGTSQRFYIGCDIGGFMTYCLEIQRSTGNVTLYHAGSNSIINHEKISATFTKAELDLSKLEFLHVSAGSQTVPIRNLIICFEKQERLHPTFDQQCKRLRSPTHPLTAPPKPVDTIPNPMLALGKTDGSRLTPCRDNINCLLQYSTQSAVHNSTFSHPCRFAEICHNMEPHLTHEPHIVPMCRSDQHCAELTDPIHRAQFRHTDRPDFLIPCQQQSACTDGSPQHRIRYSHGEPVYIATAAAPAGSRLCLIYASNICILLLGF